MKYIILSGFIFFIFSCQNIPSVSSGAPASSTQGKSHQESVKEEKKRQSEADLPFRILDPSKKIETIAFGSCVDQDLPQPIWRSILKSNPDLFILIGGGICSIKNSLKKPAQSSGSFLSEHYRKLNRNSDYREVREKIPFLAQWSEDDLKPEDKELSRNEFVKYWNYLRTTLPKNQKALYHSKIIGSKKNTLQVIVLDTDWDRSDFTLDPQPSAENTPPTSAPVAANILANTKEDSAPLLRYASDSDPSKKILSDEQWAWLENELRKPATLKIIISPLQFLANDHSFKKWGDLPLQREKLLNLIKTLKLKNIVVLSGDRQLGAIAKTEIKNSQVIYEATSSGLNKNSPLGNILKDSNYIADAYPEQNFGLVKVDWDKRQAAVQILSVDNLTQQQVEFSF